jgi:hypothetical protein
VYNDTTTTRTHALANTANWAYRSSAFDPDPSLGTGAIPGFAELANLYNHYLVRSMGLSLEIYNQDVNAYILGVWPSNVLQSVNSLLASDVIEFASNPGSVRAIMPTANGGMNNRKHFVKATGLKLFGRQFLTDLDYASGTSTNPVLPYGINIGFTVGSGANIAFPPIVSAAVTYEIEFFGLRQLES